MKERDRERKSETEGGRERCAEGERKGRGGRERERLDTMLTHVSVRKSTNALVYRHTCYSHF